MFYAIDLSEVNSINSSGLGILISCYKSVKDADGDLKLINANDKLLNIFKITKTGQGLRPELMSYSSK